MKSADAVVNLLSSRPGMKIRQTIAAIDSPT